MDKDVRRKTIEPAMIPFHEKDKFLLEKIWQYEKPWKRPCLKILILSKSDMALSCQARTEILGV